MLFTATGCQPQNSQAGVAEGEAKLAKTSGGLARQWSRETTGATWTGDGELPVLDEDQQSTAESSSLEDLELWENDRTTVEVALRDAVIDMEEGVSISDPSSDCALKAISRQFAAATGYHKHELIGKNCRFLHDVWEQDPLEKMRLRETCLTGTPNTAVILQRKKTGELARCVLHLTGLTVVLEDGEVCQYVLGIQRIVESAEAAVLQKTMVEVEAAIPKVYASIANKLAILPQIVEHRLNTWCASPAHSQPQRRREERQTGQARDCKEPCCLSSWGGAKAVGSSAFLAVSAGVLIGMLYHRSRHV